MASTHQTAFLRPQQQGQEHPPSLLSDSLVSAVQARSSRGYFCIQKQSYSKQHVKSNCLTSSEYWILYTCLIWQETLVYTHACGGNDTLLFVILLSQAEGSQAIQHLERTRLSAWSLSQRRPVARTPCPSAVADHSCLRRSLAAVFAAASQIPPSAWPHL